MKLYEECILEAERLLSRLPCRRLEAAQALWPDAGRNQLIFQNDTAYELGGGTLNAVSGIALTDSAALVPQDEILLCGKDLPDLDQNSSYARLALIRVRESAMGEGNRFYQSIRKIEYTRYHLNPKGFMLRISPMNHRESARVSKEALAEGLSFLHVGQQFLKGYHEHSAVEAVKLVFITHPDFPYSELAALSERCENITTALDHLLQKVKMDCSICGLREICAEVEELVKTDFPGA